MLDTTRQVFWGTWLFSWTCFCYSKGFSTRDQLRCVFFQIILDACLQLQNYDEQTDIAMVQEPAWANLRECCNLFATISAHAAFSDIFTLNAVGVMTEDLKHLFLIQVTNWTLWSDCNNTIVSKSSIFVLKHNPFALASKSIIWTLYFWGHIIK